MNTAGRRLFRPTLFPVFFFHPTRNIMNRHSSSRISLASALLALAALATAPSAQAFGVGDLLGAAKPAATTGALDPDGFLKAAANAEKLMGNSLTLLVRSLASKEAAASYESAMKAALSQTDAKEAQSQVNAAQASAAAALNEQIKGSQLKAAASTMSSEQRTQLGAAAFNFSLAMLQDKALIDQSKGLVSGMSTNPTLLGKLGSIKDAASSLSTQVEVGAKIAGLMPDIFGTVGVKAPASKDDKPKAMEDAFAAFASPNK